MTGRVGWWPVAKRWPGWVLLAVVVVGLLVGGTSQDSGPRTNEERIEAISKRLACPVCDGESVFESRNANSAAIRTEIRRQVEEGVASDEQIIGYFEERNARILLVPRATGIDALVWALPVAAAVCAVAGLAFAFRRWQRAADTVPDAADRALVEQALRRDADGSGADGSAEASP